MGTIPVLPLLAMPILNLRDELPEAGSPAWFDGFEKELRLGFELEKAQRMARVRAVQEEERLHDRKHIDGLGQKIASTDARTWFRWAQEEEGFWEDRANVFKFVKDNPEYRPPAAKKKIQIVI